MSPDPNLRGVGERGETLALKYLVKKGYTILERNYQTRYGEVDLILKDGTTLVFREVKLRRGLGFGDPLEAVTSRKQGRISQTAEQFSQRRENVPRTISTRCASMSSAFSGQDRANPSSAT